MFHQKDGETVVSDDPGEFEKNFSQEEVQNFCQSLDRLRSEFEEFDDEGDMLGLSEKGVGFSRKMKGGNTYIVSEVSAEQSNSELFWTQLETAIQSCDMYFEEYIVFSELIDNVDYVPGSYTEEWETPIYLKKDLFTEGFVALNKTINGEYGYMRKEVRCKYERWLQVDGEKKDYSSSFEFANGKILPYKESCDYLKELAA